MVALHPPYAHLLRLSPQRLRSLVLDSMYFLTLTFTVIYTHTNVYTNVKIHSFCAQEFAFKFASKKFEEC